MQMYLRWNNLFAIYGMLVFVFNIVYKNTNRLPVTWLNNDSAWFGTAVVCATVFLYRRSTHKFQALYNIKCLYISRFCILLFPLFMHLRLHKCFWYFFNIYDIYFEIIVTFALENSLLTCLFDSKCLWWKIYDRIVKFGRIIIYR